MITIFTGSGFGHLGAIIWCDVTARKIPPFLTIMFAGLFGKHLRIGFGRSEERDRHWEGHVTTDLWHATRMIQPCALKPSRSQ